MNIIKRPPEVITDPYSLIIAEHKDRAAQYLELAHPLDPKGRYLHFDEWRFRFPAGLDAALAWSVIKFSRHGQLSPALKLGDPPHQCRYLHTPAMHLAVSKCDQHTTTAQLEWMCSKIGESKHLQYLLNDLVEDEAISSSQLEGAATTTKAAKDLLKRSRVPRSVDEKMIIGNYKMMNFAWENRDKELSEELITELHKIGVEGIDDDKYHPGAFKNTDDVVVGDGSEVVHQPPPVAGLPERIGQLCDWINTDHTDGLSKAYMHPLIKAIILHFAIGYEHPFHDGNGRVARSLFYWFMFKKGFSAFRYIAISTLLKKAPIQYGKSYLYTETDGMDLTYFLDYQCRVLARAISRFTETYEKTAQSIMEFNAFLFQSGLYNKLSEKQRVVLNVAKQGVATEFTVSQVKDNLGCAYNTAATVLNGLVELGIFRKQKVGSEWVYCMYDSDRIMKTWKG